jgi:surface-adhesin protein E
VHSLRLSSIHLFAGAALWALGLTPVSAAPRWLPVGETDDLRDYVDVASISRKRDRASAWFVDNFFEAQILRDPRKPFLSRKSRVHFDCRLSRYAVDEIVLFAGPFGQGQVVQKTKGKKDAKLRFESVPPDSLLDDMMDAACNYRPESPRPGPGKLIV